MNPLNPKKLLLTKWTAIKPVAKQKHFLVSRVIQPDDPADPIEQVFNGHKTELRGCTFTRNKLLGKQKVSVPPESLLALGPHP